MKQSGKSSSKRAQPSYFMAILGITLVLITLGTLGWIIINANKIGDYYKENVEMRVYLRENISAKDSSALVQYISSKPYVKSIDYVTREKAKQIMNSEDNEDWDKILNENPLPNGIFFKVKSQYLNTDSLRAIRNDITARQTLVTEVKYPEELIDKMNDNLRNISIVLLAIAILLSIVVIFLIDNTIRLAMFSNRFLIKTMQMVGATRNFIVRPINNRAIIYGALSGVLASVAVFLVVVLLENRIPGLMSIRDNFLLSVLFMSLILIGVFITLFSTHRSVIKYLKMKLDDLY